MIKAREIAHILIATIILTFSINLLQSLETFLYVLLAVFVIIIVNLVAKKITAYYMDSEIETKIWQIQRYGFKPGWHMKKPFPIGAILPIVISALTLGYLPWLASLVFEVKAKVYRAAKRHGLYNFTEMSEFHIGIIAAAGIVANIVLAIAAYLIGFPPEMRFVEISILYIFFNMIPIGNLDGNKIFFGNIVIWSFLATITFIGVAGLLIIV